MAPDGSNAEVAQGSVQRKFDRVAHLFCYNCRDNPSLALINGEETLVCHCTHDDGELAPVKVHSFDSYPEPWKFVKEGSDGD